MHSWLVPLQGLLQRPQCSSFVDVSTHVPLHWENPLLHVTRQSPPVQDSVPLGSSGQALSQPPQWATLFCVLAQMPAHFTNGLLHEKLQVPPLQVGTPCVGAVQALSQVPQWATSVSVSVQSPPHSVRLPEQPPDWHEPFEHTSSCPQAMSQPPQCCPLVFVFTQAPLQFVRPVLQAMPQVPLEHVAVPPVGALHMLSQLPQFSGSFANCMHWPWHAPKPVLHAMSQLPASQMALPSAGVGQE